MRLSILGHVEASVDDRPIALGGAKQRAVLAMLGLEANRAVAADRLIEGLWEGEPPQSAPKMLQNYVWRLRQLLSEDPGADILTRGRAYELRIDPELVDVCRLDRLVSEAARAASSGQVANGAAREALALFRGDPLADVADEPFAPPEIRRLEELRLTAAELAIDADLAAGRHQEVVGELDGLIAANPLRERLHAQRMLALYRCGRQAEALEAFRSARRILVDEIGVEPAHELSDLHEAILGHDPSLDAEPPAADLPRELDTTASQPIVGREPALRRLRERWREGGSLVAVVGAYGMGKTRIAAELAGDADREGAAVLYATGTGPPEAALAAIARMRRTRRPALLVIDDADRASAEVRDALRDCPRLGLVLATGLQAAALALLQPQETIVLDPLDADAVRAIASFYGEAPPVDDLLAASRGVARRLHEAASEWARQEATRRVDVAADRAATGRTQAAEAEAELAGSVVDLQTTRARRWEREQTDAPLVCPYKGLAAFDAEDAAYFFGRERLVADLVARLVGAPLLAVVGPSGSGKSSVLRAGLLPALAGGVLPGSDIWTQAIIRPGQRPMHELRRVTRRLARKWRSIVAIDQFEELFTACGDEHERRRFVDALVQIAEEREHVIVLAIRADFYGRCAAYPELSRLLAANHVLVGPMTRDDLRRAIERPAERVGLTVEPELADALVTDVESQPGALPLLSTALLELWRERDGRRLRLAAYTRSGGVQGAVARLAEDAFVGLDPSQQAAARTLLLRLADEDEGGAIVRRRIGLGELDPAAAEVATRLTDRRLLTVSEGTVEVAHEALLREWPRLRAWLDEDVHGRRLHRQLSDSARAWDADARDAGGLYRGARLASALDWANDHAPELNGVERDFLDGSRRASERATRRLRLGIAGMACLLVLALGAGAIARSERQNALEQSVSATAQQLDAQALLDEKPDRAVLLARQAVALDDSIHTRGNLLAALLKMPAAIGVLQASGAGVIDFDLSPDGRTLALLDDDGMLRFIDTATRRAEGEPFLALGHDPRDMPFDDVRFSPDGSRVAVGDGGPVIVDARSHRRLTALYVRRDRTIRALRFSPDGRTVFAVLASAEGLTNGTEIQRFDAAHGAPLGPARSLSDGRLDVTLAVTGDGRRVVTSSDDGIVVLDAVTLQPVLRRAVRAARTALSTDGRTLLVGGRDGSVGFLDLVTGELKQAAHAHTGEIADAVFTPDGRRAVTAGVDGRVTVWDAARGLQIETLTANAGRLAALALSRDGATLYGATQGGTVYVWDLTGSRRLDGRFDIPSPGATELLPPFDLAGNGRSIAVADTNGTVSVVDLETLRPRSRFRLHAPVGAVRFLPDSRMLAIGGENGRIVLVDPRSGAVVTELPRQHRPIWAFGISRDGRVMAIESDDNTIRRLSLPSGRPAGPPFVTPDGATGITLGTDARTLALSFGGGTEVRVYDLATGRRVRTVAVDTPVGMGVGFSPDGRSLIAKDRHGRLRVWSTSSWTSTTLKLAAPTGDVQAFALSPDRRTVATANEDGEVRLWERGSGLPIGSPLPGVPNGAVYMSFTPDGAYVIVLTDGGKAFRWDVRPSSWERRACTLAGRTLTRAEWSAALPGHDYAPACTR